MSVYVDDKKKAGQKQNTDPMWKVLMKVVDLGEPTSFFDHVYWVALNESAKRAKILSTIAKICSNPEFRRSKQKYLAQGNLMQTISTRSFDMEGHAKKCVERYCELADNTNSAANASNEPPRGELRESPNDDHGVSVAF